MEIKMIIKKTLKIHENQSTKILQGIGEIPSKRKVYAANFSSIPNTTWLPVHYQMQFTGGSDTSGYNSRSF